MTNDKNKKEVSQQLNKMAHVFEGFLMRINKYLVIFPFNVPDICSKQELNRGDNTNEYNNEKRI